MSDQCTGYPNRQSRRHPDHGLPMIEGGHVPKTDGNGKWGCVLCGLLLPDFRRPITEGNNE